MQIKFLHLFIKNCFGIGIFAIFIGNGLAQAPKFPDTIDEKIDALALGASDGVDIKPYILELGPQAVPVITRKLLTSLAEGASTTASEVSAMIDMPREDGKRANYQMGLTSLQTIALNSLKVDSEVRNEAQRAIYGALKSPYMITRKTAIYASASSGGRAAVDEILPLLLDADMSNRVNAAQNLAEIGDESTADKIAAILEKRRVGLTAEEIDKDWSFRHGYHAIDKLRGKTAEPATLAGAEPIETQSSSRTPSGSSVNESSPSFPILPVAVVGIIILAMIVFMLRRRRP